MEVVRLEESRLGEASDVLARAFYDDPAWVWLIPDPARRARLLPWLFRVGFQMIEAELWAQPLPLRLFLRTEIDLETGSVNVTDQGQGG